MQRDHWDRRMRSEAQYEEKWNYAYQNPVRAGLVERPEDWLYQGDVFKLMW